MGIGNRKALCAVLAVVAGLAGCQTDSRQQVLATTKSQVALRSIQTRAFDTTAKEKTMRTIMATLQDLSFVVDKADFLLGTVSGTKFGKTEEGTNYMLRMTVTTRSRGDKQLLVRANAQFELKAVEDPEPYQDFFVALQKTMFLDAHLIAPAPEQKKTALQKIDSEKKTP